MCLQEQKAESLGFDGDERLCYQQSPIQGSLRCQVCRVGEGMEGIMHKVF